LGVIPLAEALQAARERDLDLVEVAPNSVPPVCRILDYGKFMYDQAKRERSAARLQHHGDLREVRFKVKISDHDLEMKVRRAERFLQEGDKVKLSVMFRGREIVHPELGKRLLDLARTQLEPVAIIEKPPTMEGRFMNMILGPQAQKPARPKTEPRPPRAQKAPAAETAPVASEG